MKTVSKLISLEGKVAYLSGAAGCLGMKFASTLAELGCNLILTDQKDTGLEELSNKLKKEWNIDVKYFFCDMEFEEDRRKLVNFIIRSSKNIDIVVNNAAFLGDSKLEGWNVSFEDQNLESWRRAIEVNLTSIFHIVQSLSEHIGKSQIGSIINISSIYGSYAPDWSLYQDTNISNPAAYAISKSGLTHLTKWLSTSLSPNIRVNSISPGGIFRNQDENFVMKYSDKTLMKRMATEDDLVGAIVFLATDLSSYVTGQNLIIDGGWGT